MSDTNPITPRLLSRSEAAAVLGIGISKFKELLLAGEIEQVRIDKRSLIPPDSLDQYVERLRSER